MIKNFYKILIADEHHLYAEGLKTLLMIRRHLGTPTIVSTDKDLYEALNFSHFDLVILCSALSNNSSQFIVRELRNEFPLLKTLVMDTGSEEDMIDRVFMAEADGYIRKESGPDEFFMALEQILNDGLYYNGQLRSLLHRNIKVRTTDRSFLNNMSEKETEVIGFICQENTIEQIAVELQLNPETVHEILKSIFSRVGVSNLTALYKVLFEKGLFD